MQRAEDLVNECEPMSEEERSIFNILTPALHKSLLQLCRERPTNPIDFLAFELMKHSPSSIIVSAPLDEVTQSIKYKSTSKFRMSNEQNVMYKRVKKLYCLEDASNIHSLFINLIT